MKLQDRMTLYSRTVTSDGAAGMTPGALVEVQKLWGNVKPLAGMIGMQFQMINGTQGFEVIIRTDFDFPPNREYILVHEGIFGNVQMLIHSVQVEKHYTKLICKSENKLPVQTT